MGVKELWTVLSPVKECLPLSSLAGKTLAVDLSGWVCQAHSIPSAKPHLRQLFFRVFRLYREGVRLVVVLDGEAIQLKWTSMDTRAKSTGRGGFQRITGHRSALNQLIRECTALLDVLGVPYLQSVGEAEAFCALLNKEGYVDGVLTQDGDAFLYGATVVYKDFSVTEFSVDCYAASRVGRELGLTRTDLISLALLVGCDYCPKGVPGVGKAAALKFIASCKPQDSLEVIKSWTGTPKSSECKVQRLSQGVIGFPSQAVIREFMTPRDTLPSRDQLYWKMPLVLETQVLLKRELEWSGTCPKARLLLTHWAISEKGHGLELRDRERTTCSLQPTCVVKDRKEKKVACFEVQWSATHKLAGDVSNCVADSALIEFTTTENAQLFQRAYPDVCKHFEQAKLEKKNAKIKTKPRGAKKQLLPELQSSLDGYLSSAPTHSTSPHSSPTHSTSPHSSPTHFTSPHSLRLPTHSTSPHSSPAHSTSPHSSSVILLEPNDDHKLVEKCLKTNTDEPSPGAVLVSDEEEPLPLLVRLGKSPPKEKSISSPPKQVRLDSYFPQKKFRTQKVKRTLTLGSKTEPILID